MLFGSSQNARKIYEKKKFLDRCFGKRPDPLIRRFYLRRKVVLLTFVNRNGAADRRGGAGSSCGRAADNHETNTDYGQNDRTGRPEPRLPDPQRVGAYRRQVVAVGDRHAERCADDAFRRIAAGDSRHFAEDAERDAAHARRGRLPHAAGLSRSSASGGVQPYVPARSRCWRASIRSSRGPMRIWPIFSTTARLRAGSGDETARSVPVRNRRPANHDAPPCCYFLQQGGASRSGVRCTRNAFRSYRCRNSKVNWLPSSVSQACCRVVGERANRGE